MRIIHCADIHLGSPMDSKLPVAKSNERKREVRNTFKRMVDYAISHEIKVIMLSGDVFDSDAPHKPDKDFFYNVIRSNPNIDFIYLRGNHDNNESYTERDNPNLKTFNDKWKKYPYENVDIYGIEIVDENNQSLYSSLKVDKNKINIVMLHGTVGDISGKDHVNISKLKNKSLDYLALGHLHSYSSKMIDERCIYVYSGCLEGRGFDEIGPKGFVEINIDDKITHEFIPFCERTINEETFDISNTTDDYNAYLYIKELIKCPKEDMLRINLIGEITFDNSRLSLDMDKYFADQFYFVSVKDKTLTKIDYTKYEKDISLRGEFVRSILNDNKYDDSTKQRIIVAGLKALSGGKL